ncbi:hypothetical protein ACVBEH_13040 [Roseateles sp. GG27B]
MQKLCRSTFTGLLDRLRVALSCLLITGLACSPAWATTPDDTLRIGSKRFTESFILAQVLAQTAQTAQAAQTGTGKAKVEVLPGLGTRRLFTRLQRQHRFPGMRTIDRNPEAALDAGGMRER